MKNRAYQMLEVYTYREYLVDVLTVDGHEHTVTVKAHQRNLGKNIMETLTSLFQYEVELPVVTSIR